MASDEDTEEEEIRLQNLVTVALKIGRERNEILAKLKAALLNSDDQAALGFAAQLCGLDDFDLAEGKKKASKKKASKKKASKNGAKKASKK